MTSPSSSYQLEAQNLLIRGRVMCGSRRGYEGKEEITLENFLDVLGEIHLAFAKEGRPTLPCSVGEAHLIGRTGDSAYRERLYSCDFLQSPRGEQLPLEKFEECVRAYAHKMGEALEQTRMYVEIHGQMEVWKVH